MSSAHLLIRRGPAGAAIPPAPVWRLTVEQYHQMLETGILKERDPVELLEGWLVLQMTENPPHRLAAELVRVQLEGVVPNVGTFNPASGDDGRQRAGTGRQRRPR